MSSRTKRTLPRTFTNGIFRSDCRRLTLDAEIFNSSATSATVNSSAGWLESVGIFIKEQYRIGTMNWPMFDSTVSLFRPSA